MSGLDDLIKGVAGGKGGGLGDILGGLTGAAGGGGLDDILGGLTGGKTGSGKSGAAGGMGGLLTSLLPVLGGMLASGGLQKVLAGFQANGLSAQADSWVGTGENEPISAADVRKVVGDEEPRGSPASSACPRTRPPLRWRRCYRRWSTRCPRREAPAGEPSSIRRSARSRGSAAEHRHRADPSPVSTAGTRLGRR